MTEIKALVRRFGRATGPGKSAKKTAPSAGATVRAQKAQSAICIPVGAKDDAAFVLGVQWRDHLTKESVQLAIAAQAKAEGYTHSYSRSKGAGDSYGLVKIEKSDAKAFKSLIPLAVTFAQSVQDRATVSIYVLDMPDPDTNAHRYFVTSATRGRPKAEAIVHSEIEARDLLAEWAAGQSRIGCTIYMDTASKQFFDSIALEYPSATEMLLSALRPNGSDALKAVRAASIRPWHVVAGGSVLAIVLAWPYATDLYDKHLQEVSSEEAQRIALRDYKAARAAEFETGYQVSLSQGVPAILTELKHMPILRNGWAFTSAECTVIDSTCTLLWTRMFGTYETFLESVAPAFVTLDEANYRVIKETRKFNMGPPARPSFDELPLRPAFTRRNGDRADTFNLAGIPDYKVSPFKDLAVWKGQGVPPGPVIAAAQWSITAMPDQVTEAILNRRLGNEFSLSKISMSLGTLNQVTITVEGNIYVQQ